MTRSAEVIRALHCVSKYKLTWSLPSGYVLSVVLTYDRHHATAGTQRYCCYHTLNYSTLTAATYHYGNIV
eukprot:2490-Heterococcus_DN1.PRE.2